MAAPCSGKGLIFVDGLRHGAASNHFRASGNRTISKMTEEYAVKAENPEGVVVILRRGFASKSEAEDHRVMMSKWKRVWIERIGTAAVRDA
jgi:hypothetical protein